jgi:rhamnosyltransferase subunit B
MRVLIATGGSHGDILPFIALGKRFSRLGHDVSVYANPFFEHYVQEAGLRFVPIGTAAHYVALLKDPANTNPFRGFKQVARYFLDSLPSYYEAMKTDAVPGETISVASSLLFAPRLLRETHGIPTATVHLAPAVFSSSIMPPRLGPLWITPNSPAILKRFAWAVVDKVFYDPHFTRPLNEFRSRLGLKPAQHLFKNWIHEGDSLTALFPQWFAEPQADWPQNVDFAGFPLYDGAAAQSLPAEVIDFLNAGDPPVAFTAGTATGISHRFFETSVSASLRAGRRAILLTHLKDQVPHHLPPGIAHFDYVPFAALLPAVAAFVHHGGIGSTSQACRAGVPQLIRPTAFDQFDNSARIVRLGIGKELLPHRYTEKAVAAALGALAGDPEIKRRCIGIAGRFPHDDAVDKACRMILERCSGMHGSPAPLSAHIE